MPELTGSWKLEGGFAHFLEGTSLNLLLRAGPADLDLDLTPVEFFRRHQGATLSFEADRPVRGYLPGRILWRVEPEGRLAVKLLRPDNAYLGNFRVPAGRYGIQWSVSGRVGTQLERRLSDFLFGFRTGSRATFAWVELFDQESTVREGLLASWAGFRDPFDPRSVALMRDGQVGQFSWSGSAQLGWSGNWDVTKGWQIGGGLDGWLEAAVGLRLKMGAGAEYRWRREGDYSLRWANRRGELGLILRRESGWESAASIEVVLMGESRLRSRSPKKLVDPALEPLRDRLKQGLVRRAEILMAAEALKWQRRKHWVKAGWKLPLTSSFNGECTELLAGRVPAPRGGLKLACAIEKLQGRTFRLGLNVVNWLKLGLEKKREVTETIELDAAGNLIVQRKLQIEKKSWRGENLRFLRLLLDSRPGESFRWVFSSEGELSSREAGRVMRAAVAFGLLGGDDLDAINAGSSPGTRLFWGTEFQPAALRHARETAAPERWRALVRSLELAEPDRYGRDSYWRDWIDCPSLRELVDRDPVQAHLSSRYPIPGRSEVQRRQTVSQYRLYRGFLRLVERWLEGEPAPEESDGLERVMQVPAFFFFHALCPPPTRRSCLLLEGSKDLFWGDSALLEDLTAKGAGK